jgi:hypothetical protein
MAKQILSEEFRRMQKLAGIITEEQYMNEAAGIEQFEDYVSDMFNMAIPEDAEEGEYFEEVFEKSEYGDEEEYDTEEWYGLTDYLKSIGGKATLEGNPDIDVELLPNGDIKFGATVTLDELPSDEEYKFDPASFFLAMDSNDPMVKTLIQNVKNAADSDVVKRYYIVDKLKNYAKTNLKAKDKLDDAIKFIYS